VSFLSIASSVQPTVSSVRDLWDWLSLFGGLVLFLSGAVTFIYWFAQIRRRPEADIGWSYSWGSPDGPYTDWPTKQPEQRGRGQGRSA
jgi:hypothetical protein